MGAPVTRFLRAPIIHTAAVMLVGVFLVLPAPAGAASGGTVFVGDDASLNYDLEASAAQKSKIDGDTDFGHFSRTFTPASGLSDSGGSANASTSIDALATDISNDLTQIEVDASISGTATNQGNGGAYTASAEAFFDIDFGVSGSVPFEISASMNASNSDTDSNTCTEAHALFQSSPFDQEMNRSDGGGVGTTCLADGGDLNMTGVLKNGGKLEISLKGNVDALEAGTQTFSGGLHVTVTFGRACTITGTEGSDRFGSALVGTPQDDVICGLGGDDDIDGKGGNDRIFGGPGIDAIVGGLGADRIHGDKDPDIIEGGTGIDTIFGDQGNDRIFGATDGGPQDQTSDNKLFGGPGNDVIEASLNGDTIDGGPGFDTLRGGPGQDTITGGNETGQRPPGGPTTKDGDFIVGAEEHDTIDGEGGDDDIRGNDGPDNIKGGPGDDLIAGDGPTPSNTGKDEIFGGPGRDTIDGGPVRDIIDGGADPDKIDGGPGDDDITGGDTAGAATAGFGKDDHIDGGLGVDRIEGGSGGDTIAGGATNERDVIHAGAGHDRLLGGGGPDLLEGGAQADRYDGGPGNDDLTSRDGVSETVEGGPGRDEAFADRSDHLHHVEVKHLA